MSASGEYGRGLNKFTINEINLKISTIFTVAGRYCVYTKKRFWLLGNEKN
jgi:hypothetical protein